MVKEGVSDAVKTSLCFMQLPQKKDSHVRAGKQLSFHLMLKFSWTVSGNARSVFFTAYTGFVWYSFECLITQFLICVWYKLYFLGIIKKAEYFSMYWILNPEKMHSSSRKAKIWYFEIKVAAAVKISLLDWECHLVRQHWSNLLGTFLDSYVTLGNTPAVRLIFVEIYLISHQAQVLKP